MPSATALPAGVPAGVLEAREVGKSYGELRVLHDLSLSVATGESVGLIGPNGAGKTTFFYILAGLARADRGSILLDGADITSAGSAARTRLRITYLPQEPSLFQGLSAQDNLEAILELHCPKAERAAQRRQLLEDFSLTEVRTRQARMLSGGEQQRLEIARALCCNPRFMLLDEPLAGVAPIACSSAFVMSSPSCLCKWCERLRVVSSSKSLGRRSYAEGAAFRPSSATGGSPSNTFSYETSSDS